MLPLQQRKVARTISRYVRHTSSASTVSYPAQVRAYPFMFDEKEAARRASLAVILSRPLDIFTCLGSYFLGTKPVQPLRVTAAYLPGWIIDADVQMKLWLNFKEGGKWRTIVARFKNSYMPGFAHNPLSHMSFKDFKARNLPLDAVSWSPVLEKQYDKDILCLPFTMTPFSLVNAARTKSNTKHSSDFQYDRKSLKPTFLAAYPVLMPVYLLQYKVHRYPGHEKHSKHASVIVDASTKSKVRVATENSLDQVPASRRFPGEVDMLKHTLFHFDRGDLLPRYLSNWVKLHGLFVLPVDPKHKQNIELSLDLLAESVDTWHTYKSYDAKLRKQATGTEDINWSDPRIREYSKEETDAIETYMAARSEHIIFRDMVSTLSGMSSEIKHALNTRTPGGQTGISNQLAQGFKQVLAQLNQAKPGWVKAWEAQHKEAENDSEVSQEERKAKAELEQEAEANAKKDQAKRTSQRIVHKNSPSRTASEPTHANTARKNNSSQREP